MEGNDYMFFLVDDEKRNGKVKSLSCYKICHNKWAGHEPINPRNPSLFQEFLPSPTQALPFLGRNQPLSWSVNPHSSCQLSCPHGCVARAVCKKITSAVS